jgi:CRISPR-associated exonuclease Cas4
VGEEFLPFFNNNVNTMYTDSDLLPLSALQHIVFCERQCALIHVEHVWSENQFTAEGRALHERAHSRKVEKRRGNKTERGMALRSIALGVAGVADVIEFDGSGVPFPVEYKRGRPKARNMDEVQLCAEAMCLEEMLGIRINEGALYYGKVKRRKRVVFDEELRSQTVGASKRLHEMIGRGETPLPEFGDKCRRCSLAEICMPEITAGKKNVGAYVKRMISKPIGED